MVEATITNLDMVTAFVGDLLEEMGCSMKTVLQMNVAIDEIFSNICYYAYPKGSGQAVIRVEETDDAMVCVSFEDSGTPFNPLDRNDPDVTLSLAERTIGGLGIFMVKKSMDDVRYAWEDGHNKLSLYKKK